MHPEGLIVTNARSGRSSSAPDCRRTPTVERALWPARTPAGGYGDADQPGRVAALDARHRTGYSAPSVPPCTAQAARTSAGAVRQRTRTSQESGRSAMPVHIRGGANRADR